MLVMCCRNQFVDRDVAIVMQVFKYTMNVLHAAVAVQNERWLKLQTEVGCLFTLRQLYFCQHLRGAFC